MADRALSLPFPASIAEALQSGSAGGDLHALPDPRQVMRWAIVGLSAVAIPIVLLTAEAHLGPGIRYSDVASLCVALALFSLASLIIPWQRLEPSWLLALVGGPITFAAALNSLTGAGGSPYFALYAPILAIAGWYLSGRQTIVAIALVVGTEAWRAIALDASGSVDHLVIALPFGVALAATASLTGRWLRGALIETRHEQVRMAATLDAVRALGADPGMSVLVQLELAAARLFDAQAVVIRIGAMAPSGSQFSPALVDGRTATVLVKGSKEVHALLRIEARRRLSAQDVRLASILAEAAGRTIDAHEVLRQTRADTERDPLTGLLNRRAFDRDLAAAFEGDGAPDVALVFVDLDDFKSLNDSHGHAVGDAVLVRLASILRARAREADSVYRFGGDEFAVLLRDVGQAEAEALAKRVGGPIGRTRQRQTDRPIPAFRVSAGWAVATADDTAEGLLRAADAAMYAVKRVRGLRAPTSDREAPDEGSTR